MRMTAREASRRDWSAGTDELNPSVDQANEGSLQRIADACELMAKNHKMLTEDRNMYERWYREATALVKKRDKQIAAYKGIIKRLKAQDGGAA